MRTSRLTYDLAGPLLYRDTSFSRLSPFVGTRSTSQKTNEGKGGGDGDSCIIRTSRKNELLRRTEALYLDKDSHHDLEIAMDLHGTRLPRLSTIIHEGWNCGQRHGPLCLELDGECDHGECEDVYCDCARRDLVSCKIYQPLDDLDLIIVTSESRLEADDTSPVFTVHPCIRRLVVLWEPPEDLNRLCDYDGYIRSVPKTVQELTLVFVPTPEYPRWDLCANESIGSSGETSNQSLLLHLSDLCASHAKCVTIVGTEQLRYPIGEERWIDEKGWSTEDLRKCLVELLPNDLEDGDDFRMTRIREYQDKIRVVTMVDWVGGLDSSHVLRERAQRWIVRPKGKARATEPQDEDEEDDDASEDEDDVGKEKEEEVDAEGETDGQEAEGSGTHGESSSGPSTGEHVDGEE